VFALAAFAVVAFLFINIAQAQAATLTAEEFVATDGSYKGVSVGFRTEGFGTATAVTVTLTREDSSTVIKTANQGVLDIINLDSAGGDQLTTPFVIQEGGFTEASDTLYWNPAPAVWTTETRPVSVTITITDENGETFVTNSTFNDGEPSWPTYESLLTSATPGFGGIWYVNGTNNGSEDGSAQHPYNTLEEAIAAAGTSETIEIQSDLHTAAAVLVNKSITIEGNDNTVFPEYVFTNNSNNTGLLITEDNTVVKNLTIDGIGGTALHGIHVYTATGVTLDSVMVVNNDKSGITINGSTVTVVDVITMDNGWGGINVDQGVGVTDVTTLTVNGTSAHTETGPHIWRDDNAKTDVSVVDTNAQYDSETYEYVKNTLPVTGTKYFLKAPVVPTPTPSSSGGGGGNGKKVNLNDVEDEEVEENEDIESPEGEVLGEATTTIPVMYYTFLVDFGYGTENQDVMNLHTILINLGYLDIPAPTGWYGPMTMAAVKQYQASKGIIQTGYVGPLTRAQLNMTPVGLSLIQQQIAAILVQIAALQAQLEALNEEPGE